jgi:peptide deformylase
MPLLTPDSIVQKGAPILREKARMLQKDEFDTPKIRKVIARMKEALDACDDGVAIAAPQIGESLRIFIVSHRAFAIEAEEEKRLAPSASFKDKIFINPRIIKTSRKRVLVPEGCLSVRWLYGNVLRHEKATIEAYDEHGKKFTLGGSGLMAQIFQHETDHLDGVLFIDKAKDIEEILPEKLEQFGKRRLRS